MSKCEASVISVQGLWWFIKQLKKTCRKVNSVTRSLSLGSQGFWVTKGSRCSIGSQKDLFLR